ncbi:MAG: glucan biosynthesis protein, partial [Pseudomonadota bacterium]
MGEATAFDPNFVMEKARALAAQSYEQPTRIPAAWTDITYDDYVSIRFVLPQSIAPIEPDRDVIIICDIRPRGGDTRRLF